MREFYWLTELGPTAYLSFVFLNSWMPANDGASITLAYAELAHSLGTAPARLTKALRRLANFHLAHTRPDEPATLYLQRRAPTLNSKQLARLAERCPTLAERHEQHRHGPVDSQP